LDEGGRLFETAKLPAKATPTEPDPKQQIVGQSSYERADSIGENRPAIADSSWYYAVGSAQQGPVTHGTLQQLFRIGQLPADTEVWAPGMANWERASAVPGLVSAAHPTRREDSAQSTHTKESSCSAARLAPSLKKTRFWTMFIAIFGLIACGMQFVQGIFLIAANNGTVGLGIVVVALVQGTTFLLLLIFSQRVGKFLEDRTEQRLLAALSSLHAFWMYNGILLCIAIALIILAICLMMAGVAMLSNAADWMK
jgi:hypothetical protein